MDGLLDELGGLVGGEVGLPVAGDHAFVPRKQVFEISNSPHRYLIMLSPS